MNQDNGGVIGKINTPTTTLASGVWSLDSQFDSQSSSIWPLAFPQTTIANACRFNDGSQDSLSRTNPTPIGSRRIFTISSWVKRSNLGAEQAIWSNYYSTSNYISIRFDDGDSLRLLSYQAGSNNISVSTNALYRDTSAWYHVVVAVDTTEATASDRVKIYVNGSEVSYSSTTYPSQNADLLNEVASSYTTYVGARASSSQNFDGYLAEYVYVNNSALDATSFGAFNPVTNIWEPIAYAGTYGTNGFRLDFADSSALGNDVSGNDNDFTVNNLTSVDQCTDTCSNNFATFNSLAYFGKGSALQDGNTKAFGDSATSNNEGSFSNIPVSNGKWYTEFKIASMGTNAWVGISDVEYSILENNDAQYRPFTIMVNSDGRLDVRGSGYGAPTSTASWSASYTTNDILQVAIDLDNNYFYFGKNGTYQNSGDPTSGSSGTGGVAITSGKNYAFAFAGYGSSPSAHVNFGNPAFSISSGNADANGHGNFEYAPPSGYFALCTKNIAEFGG